MKLEKGKYYWVKLVSMYRGVTPLIKKADDVQTIGLWDGMCWSLTASDEIFNTYKSDKDMGHRETCVIPIKIVTD